MPGTRLTPREEQVLRHIRLARSNKDIANDLGISEQAVKALVSRLLLKYQVHNRTSLATMVGRPSIDDGQHPMSLSEALERSRTLREENQMLMTRLKHELQDFRRISRSMRLVRAEAEATRSRSPRARRGP